MLRKLFLAVLILLLGSFSHSLIANPSGENVVAGNATFDRPDNNQLNVTTLTDRAVINWNDFSIGSNDITRFLQPGSNSAVLNRVVGGNPSSILGQLQSNGQVYLINPNGIVVGAGARIDLGSFTATTLDISNKDFMAGGDLHFAGDSKAGIENYGIIKTSQGNNILVARYVKNDGVIQSEKGTVAIGAANEFILYEMNSPKSIGVIYRPAESTEVGIDNNGILEGLRAELEAAGGNIYAIGIKNKGTIEATSIQKYKNRVLLKANDGTIENYGSIVAKKGEVFVEAKQINLKSGSLIDVSNNNGNAGTVLVGGDYQGSNSTIKNASELIVEDGARINANGGEIGDGGKVILWSDIVTSFHGNISARGGEIEGDGGFVEVSGKEFLDYQGLVDTRAINGDVGMLLLDPTNITINSAANSGISYSAGTYSGSGATSVINNVALENQLGLSNVTITTSSAGGSVGNITLAANVNWSSLYNLTLYANSVITFNSGFNLNSTGGGSVFLNAVSNINLNGGGISTNSGVINLLSGSNIILNAGSFLNSNSGNITTNSVQKTTLNSSISTNSGVLNMLGQNGVSINGDITTNGSNITLTGNAVALNGGVYVAAKNINANGGNISIIGNDSGGATTNGVLLNGSRITTSGSGVINVTGTSTGTNTGYGVNIIGLTNITSSSGNVIINGNGTGPSSTSYGVSLSSSSEINTNSGNIQLTGTANGNSTSYGVILNGVSNITSATGNISLNGSGSATNNNSYGVLVTGTSKITTANSIQLTGTGNVSTNGSGYGMQINAGGNLTTTNGNISLTGTGVGANSTGYGISLTSTAFLTSTNGSLVLNGNGTSSNTTNGVSLSTSVYLTTTNGNIIITGRGTQTGPYVAGSVYGVNIASSSNITTNHGSILLNGTGVANNATDAYGVNLSANSYVNNLNGSIQIVGNATNVIRNATGVTLLNGIILSDNGDVSIDGVANAFSNSKGIALNSSLIIANTQGNIVLNGNAYSTNNDSNYNINSSGIYVDTTTLNTVLGSIALSGLSNTNAPGYTNSYGLNLTNLYARPTTGNVTLNGNSFVTVTQYTSESIGVKLRSGSVEIQTGNLNITGNSKVIGDGYGTGVSLYKYNNAFVNSSLGPVTFNTTPISLISVDQGNVSITGNGEGNQSGKGITFEQYFYIDNNGTNPLTIYNDSNYFINAAHGNITLLGVGDSSQSSYGVQLTRRNIENHGGNNLTIYDGSGLNALNGTISITGSSNGTQSTGVYLGILDNIVYSDNGTYTQANGTTFNASQIIVNGSSNDKGVYISNGTTLQSNGSDIQITSNNTVNLENYLTLNSNNANITITGNVVGDGDGNLTANSGTGRIIFNGIIGSNADALRSLTLNTTNVNGIIQSAAWYISDNVILNAGTSTITLNNASNSFGNVTFVGGNILLVSNTSMNVTNGTSSGTINLTSNGSINATSLNSSSNNGNISITANTSANIAALNAGSGNITITSDEIDFSGGANTIIGTGNIVLQSNTVGYNIFLNHAEAGSELDFTAADLAAIADGFTKRIFGRADGTGLVTVSNAVSSSDSIQLRNLGNTGQVNVVANIVTTTNGDSIELLAGRDLAITNANISTTNGNIVINSNVAGTGTSGGAQVAIYLANININAGNANINMYGQKGIPHEKGIETDGTYANITTTGTGNITLIGKGLGGQTSSGILAYGIALNISAGGDIVLDGDSSTSGTVYGGVDLRSITNLSAGNNLTITGAGYGVVLSNLNAIAANNLMINGNTGSVNGVYIANSTLNANTGTLTLNAQSGVLASSGNVTLLTNSGLISILSDFLGTSNLTINTGTGFYNMVGTLGNTSAKLSTLNITSANASGLNQSSSWYVSGNTTLNAGSQSISLTNANNQFGDLTLTGGNVSVTENDTITDGVAWMVTGLASLNAIGNSITLDNASNQIGTLSLSGVNADISKSSGINFGATNLSGNLNAVSGGAISQSGALTVNKLILNASGSITLNNSNNNIGVLGDVTRGGNLILFDKNGLKISGNINSGTITNNVEIKTLGGNLVADNGVNIQGQNVYLTTNMTFINNSTDLINTASGRYLIYSYSDKTSQFWNLAKDFSKNGVNLSSYNPYSILETGNGWLFGETIVNNFNALVSNIEQTRYVINLNNFDFLSRSMPQIKENKPFVVNYILSAGQLQQLEDARCTLGADRIFIDNEFFDDSSLLNMPKY